MNYYNIQYSPIKKDINNIQRIVTIKKIKYYGTRKITLNQQNHISRVSSK